MQEGRKPFGFHFTIGDRVRMPNGRTGTIVKRDIYIGHFQRVWVRPDRSSHWLWRFLPTFNRVFVEDRIDALTLLAP